MATIAPSFRTDIGDVREFNEQAMRLFHFQREHCRPYRRFLEFLGRPTATHVEEIPHMPIRLFKDHKVLSSQGPIQQVFRSSGTTGQARSEHHVVDTEVYHRSHRSGFRLRYGDIRDYVVLALLPGYLDRGDSSLVYMVQDWITASGRPESGFYLDDLAALSDQLKALKTQHTKVLLIGVTYALLDFAAAYPMSFPDLLIMETGGMKGQRREMLRSEVHDILREAFGVEHIHSEYGMTELLSQAYALKEGWFQCPPWMRVSVHDMRDRLSRAKQERSGLLHIIDLANVHSCAFIATDDLGRAREDGTFEVLGRFDQSEVRGCNLMVQ